MNQKGFIGIIVIIVALLAMLGVATYFVVQKNGPSIYTPFIKPNPNPVACTQEAKQCPDGSYVSRTGPKCEFAKCPDANPIPQPGQVILKEGEKAGSLLVQKIYIDYITGLNYREYPVAYSQGQPITLRIGETASNGCTVTMTLVKIQGGAAYFTKKEDYTKPCPICLAGNTLIDTPAGKIPVKDLKVSDLIWTMDLSGRRAAGTIQKTSKVAVPLTHEMVHLILADGREVLVSSGHPTIDGRAVGDLLAGEMYDGSIIKSAARESYDQGFTYDILPSGKTGFYWANGVLLGSTLSR